MFEGYLDAWLPILVQHGYRPISYFEAFAGPGVYSGGEPGSPIVALRSFLKRADRIAEQARSLKVVLLEERQDRLDRLRSEVAAQFPELPANVEVSYHQGRCQTDALRVLGEQGCWGGPVLAILDAWGVDVPMTVVQRIAGNLASEVIVTFTLSYFVRFPDDGSDKGDQQMGSPRWREVASLPTEEKPGFIVDLYREALRDRGLTYTIPFELVDEGGHALFLIFASGHPLGFSRFKDAMWKVDPVRGVSFRDPRDPAQQTFQMAEHADLRALRQRILGELRGGPKTVEDLQRIFFNTVYKASHVADAAQQAVALREAAAIPPGKVKKTTMLELA